MTGTRGQCRGQGAGQSVSGTRGRVGQCRGGGGGGGGGGRLRVTWPEAVQPEGMTTLRGSGCKGELC